MVYAVTADNAVQFLRELFVRNGEVAVKRKRGPASRAASA
jgi:hypothetical protein